MSVPTLARVIEILWADRPAWVQADNIVPGGRVFVSTGIWQILAPDSPPPMWEGLFDAPCLHVFCGLPVMLDDGLAGYSWRWWRP